MSENKPFATSPPNRPNLAAPPQAVRLVFEYNPATQSVSWRVEGAFPLPFLVNALEMAKAAYVAQEMMAMQVQRPKQVCLADGSLPGEVPG